MENNGLSYKVGESIDRLRSYIEAEGFKGYDPYDALQSPVLRALSMNLKPLRMAFIQALKGLPINVRPLLLIPKGYNPKGIGLMLWGYAKLHAVEGGRSHLGAIERLLDLLEGLRSPGCSGSAWGYNFDWQSRVFYLPRRTPTVVNTSFIGHALIDAHRLTGSERALALALSAREFILRDLHRTYRGDALCLSYSPIDHTAIHNANLLGASLLIRLAPYLDDEGEARRTALAALRFSMEFQRADGSWPYAETAMQSWVDSFHTGFNLQCLWYFLCAGEAGEYREAFKRGMAFYARNFFLEDGTPKYYHNRLYPIDIHAPAQALALLCLVGGEHRALADRVAGWMIDHMRDGRGYFHFRKHRFHTNRIPYMRWAQAWAFHGLTEWLYGRGRARGEGRC